MSVGILKRWRLAAAFGLVAACASNPYARIAPELGAADPVLQDLIRRARAGDGYAKLALGMRFEAGDGVTKDCEMARALYASASRQYAEGVWVYSPPVSKNDTGRIIHVGDEKLHPAADEARERLNKIKCQKGRE